MTRQEYATELRKRGYNCAQAVLAATADMHYMLDEEVLLAAGGGLGGGARQGELCGAASGAVVALGFIFPHNGDGDNYAKAVISDKTRVFMEKFKKKYGNLACSKLLEVDMSRPDGLKAAMETGAIERCAEYIAGAISILEEMLEGENS